MGKAKLGDTGEGTGRYAPSSSGISESKLVTKIVKALHKEFYNIPHEIIKMHGGLYQRSGIPDLYIQIGAPLWVEVKLPGGDTTALQKQMLENLKDAGAYVTVCDCVEDAIRIAYEVLKLLEELRHPL
jgi:hypothetical protein